MISTHTLLRCGTDVVATASRERFPKTEVTGLFQGKVPDPQSQ